MSHRYRPTPGDRAWLARVNERVTDAPEARGDQLIAALTELLHDSVGPRTAIFLPERTDTGWSLEYMHTRGFASAAAQDYAGSLQHSGDGPYVHDPLKAPPAARNVIHEIPVEGARLSAPTTWEAFRRHGVGFSHQHRMLICEGAKTLAWFGVFRDRGDALSPRERWRFLRLAQMARRALPAARMLPHEALTRTLEAALEAHLVEAFVLRSNGTPEFANSAGQQALVLRGAAVRAELAESLRAWPSRGGPFDLQAIAYHGSPRLFLALRRSSPESELAPRLRHALKQWRLTHRQSEILALLAEGASTKDIAARLSLSPRTVDLHVAELLDRAGAESRLELIARLWRRDGPR